MDIKHHTLPFNVTAMQCAPFPSCDILQGDRHVGQITFPDGRNCS